MTGNVATDGELVLCAAAGSRDAFDELFARHQARVAAVCRQRLRSTADVDDAVQEAFARALAKLGQLNNPDRFASWVTTIAIRVCNDQHRATRRTIVLDMAAGDHSEVEDAGPRPDELVEAAEHSASVRASFAALGERDREALFLRHVAEAPVSVVASRLGLTEGSTRVLLTRARHRLRAATSSLPALIPWRPWRRDHLPWATPALEAMAVAVALGVAASTVSVTPPGPPARGEHNVAASAALADVAPMVPPSRPRKEDAKSAGAPRTVSATTARRVAERPKGAVLPVVASSVQVRDDYPDEEETQEIVDVTIFTRDEQANLRLYADEVTDAVRDSRRDLTSTAGEDVPD